MNVLTSSLRQLSDAIRKKDLSSVEVTERFMGQIEKWNPKINAYITLNEKALDQAKAVDARLAKGENVGPLAGVPVAIKDMLCTKGLRTTAASKILHNFVPPYSATVVERLEGAGAINLGKTNLDEFAMGSSTETSAFGLSRNPWNIDYVPGGSSGGSAAAVAGGMAAAAIGTDTGGSIRQPAGFCSLVGVKPTYGRVSRYGIVAFASSLDQAGPMTRTVEDSALIMESICGRDPRDSTTSAEAVPAWSKQINKSLKGIKVGLPKEYFSSQLGTDTRAAVERAIEAVKRAGAETVEISLPLTEMAVPIYYLVCTSEASSNLARYDGVRFGHRADFSKKPAEDLAEFYCRTRGEGFGTEVKRRIILGTYALSSGYYDAYYKKAGQVRRLLRQQFLDAFKQCQLLMSPVTTSPAFKIGDRISDPLAMYLNDIYTTSANLVGIPGMSVPAGFSKDGLPIGVQLLASHFQEQHLFNAGSVIEETLALKELPHVLQ
ncbi:MAG: Asp-tRNA(Asn)/Glu-tRNA(Gln) amidotransferase subunit GatA [Bdellovibrionales bacterium]|nr:Asp-tRNA(Asn)/Glu-tRNA(Gln) amidotransferase subunit GatA [Bdellovibrionales bacterium]